MISASGLVGFCEGLAWLAVVEPTPFTAFDLNDAGFMDMNLDRAEAQAAHELDQLFFGRIQF